MIYKKQDLDRIFTEAVTHFLSQGFQISARTRSECHNDRYSGEISSIDLYKGDDLLRVQLYNHHFWRYSLLVRQCALPHLDDSAETKIIYNSNFDTIREICFYPVDKHSTFEAEVFGDEATAKAAQSKRDKRRQRRRISQRHELPACAKTSVLKWLREKPRMKTCRLNEIESVSRVNKVTYQNGLTSAPELDCYEIKARGRVFIRRPTKKA